MPKDTTYPPKPPKVDQPWTPEEVGKDYPTINDLKEYAKKEEAMPAPEAIEGYDPEANQILKHDDEGNLYWEDEELPPG